MDELMSQLLDDIIRGMTFGGENKQLRAVCELLESCVCHILSPEMILTGVLALVFTAFLIGVILAVHLMIDFVRRRKVRARAFISYEHDRELIADKLAAAIENFRVKAVKLPFEKDADHDTLLDRVKKAIRGCDVFVCIPGTRPSFVENEVSMAFQRDMPLLFVVDEADAPRLPNTAKKGYPIFDLEQLKHEEFRTLAYFCSYLAADWPSTIRLFGTVFQHTLKCSVFVPLIYIVTSIVLVMIDVLPSEVRGVTDVSYHLALPFAVTFLVIYGLFTMSRWANRKRLRWAVSGKNFSERFLPKTLEYSLTRENILNNLYRGNMAAEHESDSPVAHSNAEQRREREIPGGQGQGRTGGRE